MTQTSRTEQINTFRARRARNAMIARIGLVLAVLAIPASLVVVFTAGLSFMELATLSQFGQFLAVWEAHGILTIAPQVAFFTGAALFFKFNNK